MIALDEGALYCDFIEYYHMDFKEMPALTAALMAVNLPVNSRIKLKQSGLMVSVDTFILGAILDALKMQLWAQSKQGTPKPKSILQTMVINDTRQEKDLETYDSPDDFKKAWKEASDKWQQK